MKTRVIREPFRLDAEYYAKKNLMLEELINSTKGRTIKSLNGKVDCSAFYPSITGFYSSDRTLIPFIRVNEIQNGLVILTEDTVFLPQKVLDDNPTTISKAYPGDIVIAKGGNTLAKVGLVTNEYSAYATCRDVIILRVSELKDINNYYLWSFLHSKYGQDLMWRSACQTGQPHITLPIIMNMHIPIFSEDIPERVKELYVASTLKQKESSQKFSEAEQILESLIGIHQDEVDDEVSATVFLQDVINMGRIDAEYYQHRYKKIKECIEKIRHFYFNNMEIIDQNVSPEADEFYQYIELSNVGENGIINGCNKNYGKYLPTRARRRVKAGDVIVSSIEGSLEKCALVDIKFDAALCSNGFYVIRTSKLKPEVLLVIMKSWIMQQLLKRACSGTILMAFGKEELKRIPIPYIDETIQNSIVSLVNESFALHDESVSLLEQTKLLIEKEIEEATNR